MEALKTMLTSQDALRFIIMGLIFVPATVAMLASAWFMINALVYGIASEFETRTRVGDLQWFNPFRFFSNRDYSEKGQHLKTTAIREFKRAMLALFVTLLLVGGIFLTMRFFLKVH